MNQKLIPFDIEAAKKGAKVVTREGFPVRILCFDKKSTQPIVGLVDSKETTEAMASFNASGAFFENENKADYDLFLLSEPQIREWTEDDAPLGAVVRGKVTQSEWLLVGATEEGVELYQLGFKTYADLRCDYEWKWPHEKDEEFRAQAKA